MHPAYAYAHGALVKMAEYNVDPYSFMQAAAQTQDPLALKVANALVAYEKVGGNLLYPSSAMKTSGVASKLLGGATDPSVTRQFARGQKGNLDLLMAGGVPSGTMSPAQRAARTEAKRLRPQRASLLENAYPGQAPGEVGGNLLYPSSAMKTSGLASKLLGAGPDPLKMTTRMSDVAGGLRAPIRKKGLSAAPSAPVPAKKKTLQDIRADVASISKGAAFHPFGYAEELLFPGTKMSGALTRLGVGALGGGLVGGTGGVASAGQGNMMSRATGEHAATQRRRGIGGAISGAIGGGVLGAGGRRGAEMLGDIISGVPGTGSLSSGKSIVPDSVTSAAVNKFL